MRQTFSIVLATVAGIATTSQAYFSEYWTHWDDTLAEIMAGPNCGNGPALCGTDEDGADVTCMTGYGCFRNAFSDICDDVARYHCFSSCEEGETLNPLKYC